jgi:hypothetical protein
VKDIFSERAAQRYHMDTILYGTGMLYKKQRHFLNPLRYLMGIIKLVHIDVRKTMVQYQK